MNTNKQSKKRNHQNPGKKEKNSSRTMKFFYALMLLLIASSSLIRIAGASRRNTQEKKTPTPQVLPAGGGSTAARVLVFHRESTGANLCEDLVITAAGNAIYSTCGNGAEKQSALSETERVQLQSWIEQFQTVNYDYSDTAQADAITTHLFLNGQGSRQADDAETQQIIDFAAVMATKIASQ